MGGGWPVEIKSPAAAGHGNVAAQIWYTKSQMGWKETQALEIKKTGFEGMSADDLARAIQDRANAAGVKVTLSVED